MEFFVFLASPIKQFPAATQTAGTGLVSITGALILLRKESRSSSFPLKSTPRKKVVNSLNCFLSSA